MGEETQQQNINLAVVLYKVTKVFGFLKIHNIKGSSCVLVLKPREGQLKIKSITCAVSHLLGK